MAIYSYRLIDKDHRIKTGTHTALTKGSALRALSKDGATVLLITNEGRIFGGLKDIEISFLTRGFSTLERIIFFRNFSSMLSVDVPMITTLSVLEEQAKKKKMKRVIEKLREDVENGKPLSDAMRRFPQHFPEYIIETLRVGEFTGGLSETLDKISITLEHDYEISRKVTGAIAYPLVVITVMVAVVVLLVVTVLPKIAQIFEEFNAPMPLPTRILIGIGTILGANPFLISGSVLAIIAAIIFTYKTRKGKYIFHYLFLKLPIFGELIKEYNLVRFFRSLEVLFKSGIPLVRSVAISEKTMKNVVYRTAIASIHPALMHGAPLTEVLKPFPKLFSLQTRRTLEVGERAGKYDETFVHLTRQYERSIHHRVTIMNSLLEPVLMLCVGVVVGGIALSIFMPIYQVSNVL